MLPTVMTAKSTIIAALAALSIVAVPAAPAHAWGDKEQGFVAGVATAVIVDELLKQSRQARAYRRAPAVAAPTYFVEPRQTYATPTHTATTSIYRTPAAQAFNSYSRAERKAIQRALRSWGYYRGGLDGAFGPGTYNAISAYARDEGVSANLRSTNTAYAVYDGLIF
ncbi:peptidoglycan-binding domain-containing protein [Tabrizicola sp. BL-A-41-H6]|uniref:peptidoglycan-binding domain-containing protein n=1 Tax=Tabrizicola sp. BL-A-41-H6 TaxID=3421107 RepID=UPI003D6659D8